VRPVQLGLEVGQAVVKDGGSSSGHMRLGHLFSLVLAKVLHDALQLGDSTLQVALDLLDGQRLHESQADVDGIVVALDLAPYPAQQAQKLDLPGLGNLIDGPRGTVPLLLDGDLFDEPLLGQLFRTEAARATSLE